MLTDHLLIWQNERRVELRSLQLDGWSVKTFRSGQTVQLSRGIQFTVDELYAS